MSNLICDKPFDAGYATAADFPPRLMAGALDSVRDHAARTWGARGGRFMAGFMAGLAAGHGVRLLKGEMPASGRGVYIVSRVHGMIGPYPTVRDARDAVRALRDD